MRKIPLIISLAAIALLVVTGCGNGEVVSKAEPTPAIPADSPYFPGVKVTIFESPG